MEGIVCSICHSWLTAATDSCPSCSMPLILSGENKTVIDHLEANCLIHRYNGSDLLEPAIVIKEGKTNLKVATKLREYPHPVTVPKHKVYHFDSQVLSAIQALRTERTTAITRYDDLIKSHWQKLQPYTK